MTVIAAEMNGWDFQPGYLGDVLYCDHCEAGGHDCFMPHEAHALLAAQMSYDDAVARLAKARAAFAALKPYKRPPLVTKTQIDWRSFFCQTREAS